MRTVDVGARTPDAQNASAVRFARMRLAQMQRAGLLGQGHIQGDPTAIWRSLSATLAQNPQAMSAFQQVRRPALLPQTGTPAARQAPLVQRLMTQAAPPMSPYQVSSLVR